MKIYADNAATTKMCPAAIEAMLPFLDRIYGNPSSLHSVGQEAAEALADARQRIAACIGADPGEIVFTSGGSEADNQALRTAAALGEKRGKRHIVSTNGWGGSRAGSISYPPHSSITLSCTPWRS